MRPGTVATPAREIEEDRRSRRLVAQARCVPPEILAAKAAALFPQNLAAVSFQVRAQLRAGLTAAADRLADRLRDAVTGPAPRAP